MNPDSAGNEVLFRSLNHPVLHFLGQCLNYPAANLGLLEKRLNRTKRRKGFQISDTKAKTEYNWNGEKLSYGVRFQKALFDECQREKKDAFKVALYIITYANEHGGIYADRDSLFIPYRDMVRAGLAVRTDKMKRAMEGEDGSRKGIAEALESIEVSYIDKRHSKKGKALPWSALFHQIYPTRGGIKITLGAWAADPMNAFFFTLLPDRVFALDRRAFALAEFISFTARQNIPKLKQDGSYTISREAIALTLALPDEARDIKNRNTGRTAKYISQALTDINGLAGMSITEEAGKYRVRLSGRLLESVLESVEETEKSIQKKQTKIYK